MQEDFHKCKSNDSLGAAYRPKFKHFFCCLHLSGDVVNKIQTCGVAVIPNPLVCNVCVFHATVFGDKKLFAMKNIVRRSFCGKIVNATWDNRKLTKVEMRDISSPLAVACYLAPCCARFGCIFDVYFPGKKVSQIQTSHSDNNISTYMYI